MIDYFAHPAISNSKLEWFKRSPAHFKYFQEKESPDKPSYLIGSVSHCILFEPDKFNDQYFILDESKRPNPDADFRSSVNNKWRKEIKEAYAHKKAITVVEYDMVMAMMERIKENSFAQELLVDCVFEKEVFWTDPHTGIECKKKVDGECATHRIDYKTTDNADPAKWQKKTWSYSYYRQAGFYDLSEPKEFYFIVQEKTAPYMASVHKCTPELINYGKDEAVGLLRKLKVHIDQDIWPGYEQKIFKPELDINDRAQNYYDFDIPGWVLQNM